MIGKITSLALICVVCSFSDGEALCKQGASLFKDDPFQALELFEQAAEQGNVSAMVGAGHCYETGVGASTDYTKAIAFYEQAVKQNSLKACEGLARIYAACPEPEFHDGAKAVKFAGAVARKKPRESVALTLLAKAQARNMDFPNAGKTLVKAQRVAGLDQIPVLKGLKSDFEKGIPSPAMASEIWIMQAADAGVSTWAMLKVAGWCEDEAHSMYDLKLARMWYERGSQLKSPEAALKYGVFCLKGIGGPEDLESAIAALEQALAGGATDACYHLGWIYFSTTTGKRDMDEAYKYYSQLHGTTDQTIEWINTLLRSDKLRDRIDEKENEELYKSGEYYSVSHTYTTYDIYGNSSGSSTTPARHGYALVYFLAAAESGHFPSMLKVISIYSNGNSSINTDAARAELWKKRLHARGASASTIAGAAADHRPLPARVANNARALNQEARKYRGYEGYPKDPAKEFELYLKSCELDPSADNGYAAYVLWHSYKRGLEGVPKNPARADEYRHLAAEHGHPEALNSVIHTYASNPETGKKARDYAEKLLKYNRLTYRHLDTIARGFAANGEFSKAVRYQRDAIKDLSRADEKYQKPRTKNYNDRLTAYTQKRMPEI